MNRPLCVGCWGAEGSAVPAAAAAAPTSIKADEARFVTWKSRLLWDRSPGLRDAASSGEWTVSGEARAWTKASRSVADRKSVSKSGRPEVPKASEGKPYVLLGTTTLGRGGEAGPVVSSFASAMVATRFRFRIYHFRISKDANAGNAKRIGR